MRHGHGRNVLAGVFVAALMMVSLVDSAVAGYGLNSNWDPATSTFTWEIYVESGSPAPFKGFHVTSWEGNHFSAVEMPPGWHMRLFYEPGGAGAIWVSLYGDSACTEATFRVRYTGGAPAVPRSDWRLTDDGNYDATTGVVLGAVGNDALGPWNLSYNTDVKVAVHVMPHTQRTCTDGFPDITDYSDIIATCSGHDVDFFPVFFDIVDYMGAEYSVEWPGTYSCAFTSCSDFTIGDIVWPAGSVPYEDGTDAVAHAWRRCQSGPVAIPGWGRIYEPGSATIRIVPSTSGGFLKLGACNGWWNDPICNFGAGIGGADGQAPYGSPQAAPTTWGAIKNMFR